MLGNLVVKNFAIIDDISIQFTTGLNIITGESGAGKSLLIKALTLLTGERADTTFVKDGVQKAFISAEFLGLDAHTLDLLASYDLDTQESCIIRRVIDTSGKSKIYINDIPVSLIILKQISTALMSISSQNSHQMLLNPKYQLSLIDETIGDTSILQTIGEQYKELSILKERIATLEESRSHDTGSIDFIEFQLKEFHELDIDADEVQTIETQYEEHSTAKHTIEDISSVVEHINNSEQYLNSIEHLLEKISVKDAKLAGCYELASACKITFIELHYEIQNYLTSISSIDNEELEKRISLLYDVARKHNCTIAQLPDIQSRLEHKLYELTHADEALATLKTEFVAKFKDYLGTAKKLSALRAKSAYTLEQRVNTIMNEFAMSYMKFSVHIATDEHHLSKDGCNTIEFMISAGNTDAKPLRKIASGGELSRINLALTVITSSKSINPVLVFDEVDSGISGEIAKVVAHKLKKLSATYQTLCITHQPQVAAKSNTHIQITKELSDTNYTSNVRYLDEHEKLEEIAKLIGGNTPSKHHLATAKEMIQL